MPNSSFEIKSQCPFYAGQIEFSKGWFKTKANSYSDYYNVCGTSMYSIPSNGGGYQIAKEGNAYAGVYLYHKIISNLRQYISIKLKSPFRANIHYKISFYVSLADTSMYGIDNIGVFLSDFNPDTSSVQVLDFYQPQISNPDNHFLVNSDGWKEISGIYKAMGGEEYITIGNFFPDSLTEYELVNSTTNQPHAYYYIDDVSVIKLPDQDISTDSIYYTATCSDSAFLQLRFQNQGAKALDFTKDTVIFRTEVKLNGTVVKNFDLELNSNSGNPVPNTPLAPDSFMTVKIGPVDLFSYGSNYQITVSSFSVRDSNSSNDTLVFDMVPKYQEECFKLIIPNVFTPNGDGVNDTFYFQNAENKKLHTQILNRWGEEVASWSGNQGWDGAELPSGVYYYLVKEMNNETIVKTHKGKVSILR